MQVDKAVVDGDRVAERELEWKSIVETSVVTTGDNAGESKVLMTKAKEDAGRWERAKAKVSAWLGRDKNYGQPRTVDQILMFEAFEDQLWKLRMAFSESAYSIMECAEPMKMAEMMATSAEQFSRRVKDLVAQMSAGDAAKAKALMELVERLNTEAIALKDAKGAHEKRAPIATTLEALETFKFTDADFSAEGSQMTVTAAQKTTTDNHGAELDARLKALDEAITKAQARAEKAEADAAAANARAEKAETEAQKLMSQAGETVFTDKAKRLAVGDVAKVRDALKSAYGISKDAGENLEEVLRSCAAIVRKAEAVLGKQLGFSAGSHGGDDGAQTPDEQLDAMAKAHQEKHPGVSAVAARKAVMDAKPALKQAAIAAGIARRR